MAQIYLQHRNDKRMYANTYKELAETFPSVHTYLFLGDAYMNIQEVGERERIGRARLKR